MTEADMAGRPRGKGKVSNFGRPVGRDTEPRAVNSCVLPYIVAATYFMECLDTTVIASTLPQIARSFSVGPNDVSLGMTAYRLTLAVFIPISGWIADRFGSWTKFGSGLVIFTLASVLCGFSTGCGGGLAFAAGLRNGGSADIDVGHRIHTPAM
jgi:MFS family permease